MSAPEREDAVERAIKTLETAPYMSRGERAARDLLIRTLRSHRKALTRIAGGHDGSVVVIAQRELGMIGEPPRRRGERWVKT